MKLSFLIDDILRLGDESAVLAATSTPEPGGMLLSPIEFDLYELHADALDLSFTSPWKVLEFLKKKLGYTRIQEGEKIIAHYRFKESNPLVAYFDGLRGEVKGVDEVGRPWVKFRDQDWEKAVSSSKVKSMTGVSPLEVDGEIVQSRLLTLRLDPMDVQGYRFQMAKLGYVYPRANLLSPSWMHILPKSSPPMVDLYDTEDSGDEGDVVEEPLKEEEKNAYYYDPLVTDLVSMSHEQMRYILDNAEEFLLDLKDDPDYIPDGDKPNFIDWNPPEGHTEGAYQALLEVLPLPLEVDAKQSLPSSSYPPTGVKGGKAKRLWRELMTSPKFVKSLRNRPAGMQWAIAHHVHVLRCNRNQVKPFDYWTPEHQKKFDTRHKSMQKSLHHKRKFMKAHGETPEQYRKRTGKCPQGFTYIEERQRCIHK